VNLGGQSVSTDFGRSASAIVCDIDSRSNRFGEVAEVPELSIMRTRPLIELRQGEVEGTTAAVGGKGA
jgi:hypothetical protein